MPQFSRFILASGSPRRRELLASLGIEFEVIKSNVDETIFSSENPFDYVQRLSRVKAQSVAVKVKEEDVIILAADTIVIVQNSMTALEILAKPESVDSARSALLCLRGRPHTVCTAFTLYYSRATLTRMVSTSVYMRDYTDSEIEAYINSGDPFDKAGGYAIQNKIFHPVEYIEGSYSNVVGLPICTVRDALLEIGYPLNQTETNLRCDELDGM